MRGLVDQLAADLDTSHAALLERAHSESPELVARLTAAPPEKRRSGWGILPEIVEDAPRTPVTPSERRYSLKDISVNFAASFRDGRILAGHTVLDPAASLERAVAEYERLRGDLKNVKEHLAYHEQWQRAVTDQADYFDDRNEIVSLAREWQSLRAQGADPARIGQLESEIRERVAVFRAAPDLAIERAADEEVVLPVSVHTDISNGQFLDEFREAVQAEWSGSDAAQSRRVSIRLEFVRVPIEELYPGAALSPGAEIDVEQHVARFPEDALVMTTGAASTHAWKGRSLLIGPEATTGRVLAHEFGHLLGFGDAYLRGFDGRPADPHGVVLVEWTGLLDDLMGNPAGGRVTEAMIDRLVEAYGRR
jgi:hypothetical protein